MSPENKIKTAQALSRQSRRSVILAAAKQIATRDGYEKARNTLQASFTNDEIESVFDSFHWQLAHDLIGKEKFSEATKMVELLPKRSRIDAFINIASRSSIDANSKAHFESALTALSGLTKINPQNEGEMEKRIKLIRLVTKVDSNRAFEMFEPLRLLIAKLQNASATLNSYQNRIPIRKNEFILSRNGSIGVHFGEIDRLFGDFAKSDFERTINLINGFSRPEFRLKLMLDTYKRIKLGLMKSGGWRFRVRSLLSLGATE